MNVIHFPEITAPHQDVFSSPPLGERWPYMFFGDRKRTILQSKYEIETLTRLPRVSHSSRHLASRAQTTNAVRQERRGRGYAPGTRRL